jgi:hypothetical protein
LRQLGEQHAASLAPAGAEPTALRTGQRRASNLPIRFVGISRMRRDSLAQGSLFLRRNDVFVPLGKPQK